MTNEISNQEMQEYCDDFWDTFNAEEKAALKAEGLEERLYGIVYVVDFQTKRLIARKDMR